LKEDRALGIGAMESVEQGRLERRLAAIIAADVAGYSRLMAADEEGTLARFKAHRRELIDPKIAGHRGRIVKTTGDGMLVVFASIVDAMQCAIEFQRGMAEHNAAVPSETRIQFRIGLNLGDIMIDGDDIHGDGVNIAARLEALAEPGGICISRAVLTQTRGKLSFEVDDLGEQALKNMAEPVHVFRVVVEGGRTTRAAALPLSDKSSIAVLPFQNISSNPEQEYFADGITEDIITMLAGWRAFPVIARNSTFTYKGKTVDIKTVGRELGSRYVLEGSVRKLGSRVRVTAQLIQADTGHHLMAERYDRDLSDLFEVQDEIVTAIVGAIEPEVLKTERDRIAGRPQHRQDAYEFYQRGQWHHYRHSKLDNVEAQTFFRRALAIDSQYEQAIAALALAVCNAAFLGWAEDTERNYIEAYELAQRAVALDARYPAARYALGAVCMWTSRSDRAIAEFREAINLDPSFAAAWVVLGQMFIYAGRPEEAIPLAEKGISLSPYDPRLSLWLPALAGAHYQLRHYAQAVEIGLRSWALNRNWPAGLRYAVAGLAQLGRIDEAQAALADLRLLDRSLSFVEANLQRLFKVRAPVDHILDGLHKAGFE
jgi:adenylate cyclase